MFGITIQQPTELFAQINQNIGQAPKLFQTAYKRNMGRVRSRWIRALGTEPPAASNAYALPWTSEKQRRAFFATKGFGRGIPTHRTHELSKSNDVQIDTFDEGGTITVLNTSPSAKYVYGDIDTPQQVMFAKIGWLDPNEVNAQFQDEAVDVLTETFYTVFDPFAGVPE